MIKGYYDVIKCKLNIPTIQPKLQMKEITPSTEEQYIIPDEGYDGLASAIVEAVTNEIDPNILPENIRLGKSILGISGNLEPDKPDQSKTVIPTTEEQTVRADEGYELAQVTVEAVTNEIDPNILPENIRLGKSILGISGNLEPDKPDQNKTVTPSTIQQVVVADEGYELAQVTVEAVPDETPELNTQDTALSNQETVIGQLSSALDNKIALDLQAATSDANATANDIAKDKTAYVNGVKLTGNIYEANSLKRPASTVRSGGINIVEVMSGGIGTKFIIGTNSSIGCDVSYSQLAPVIGATASKIKKDEVICGVTGTYEGGESSTIKLVDGMKLGNSSYIPDNLDTSDVVDMSSMFINCQVTNIPAIDTSKASSMDNMFFYCTKITTIPTINTSNVINMSSMFSNCSALKTVPQLDTTKVINMNNMFSYNRKLSNESLNNILAMCANTTSAYTGTKTLKTIGLSQTQAETCQTLSNWNDFIAAGWSTGY